MSSLARVRTLATCCKHACRISNAQSRLLCSVKRLNLAPQGSAGCFTARKFQGTSYLSIDETSQNNGTNGNAFLIPGRAASTSAPVPEEIQHDTEEKLEDDAGNFDNFDISESVKAGLRAKGIEKLFPVQYETIGPTMEGKDVVVQARTGTGKTFSFAIPLIEMLLKKQSNQHGRPPRVLVMAPTRELAVQVCKDFKSLNKKLSIAQFYGGVSYDPQMQAMREGIDILVGTPGRIMDNMSRGLDLSQLEHVVLDEVDRMLDMGFAGTVEDIIKSAYSQEVPPQTLMYSATMPPFVYKIGKKYMKNDFEKINLVGGESNTRTSTTVEHLSINSENLDPMNVVKDIVKFYAGPKGKTLVFCDRKLHVDNLVQSWKDAGIGALHGDISQLSRENTLNKFKSGKINILIATEVAARGLDIANVDLVVQLSPPLDVDSYIHKSGRTGRAGKTGVSICLFSRHTTNGLRQIEREANIKFKSVPLPTFEDMTKASLNEIREKIEKVSTLMSESFEDLAESLIEKMGAVSALSSALAAASGMPDPSQKSLITGDKGYVTYILKSEYEIRSTGYIHSILGRLLPNFHSGVDFKNDRLTSDGHGLVFDVSSEMLDKIDNMPDTRDAVIERCTELPDLKHGGFSKKNSVYSRNSGYGQSGRNSSYGQSGRNSSYRQSGWKGGQNDKYFDKMRYSDRDQQPYYKRSFNKGDQYKGKDMSEEEGW